MSAHAEFGGRGRGVDHADDAVGGRDDGTGPGGRHPRGVPEETRAGTRRQQARAAQPSVVAPGDEPGQPGGDERPPGGVNRRNGRAHQLQHVLRAGQAGASCHAAILRRLWVSEIPDLQLGSGRHFHDVLRDVQQGVRRCQPAQMVRRRRAVTDDGAAAPVSRIARRNCRLPRGEVSASLSTAGRRGRSGSGRPMAVRSAGRMNTSNDTSALTGLPGSVTIVAPAPFVRKRPMPCGIPGCIATLTNSTPWSPSRPKASLTTS